MNTHRHISVKFEKELNALQDDIVKMGQFLTKRLEVLSASIVDQAPLKDKSILENEKHINELEIRLDTKCLNLLALHSPTASDLRFIISASRIVNDLESAGDEITRTSLAFQQMLNQTGESKEDSSHSDLKKIVDELTQLLGDTLTAYQEGDTQAAASNIIKERAMDEIYKNAVRARITWIMEDPRIVKAAVHVFWILRSMERIGKCIRQINNHIIFEQKGTDTRHMSSESVRYKFIKKAKSAKK